MNTKYKFTLPCILLGASSLTQAAPFFIFDARSAAMGNTGVASGNLGQAMYMNPAMLAEQKQEDDFSIGMNLGLAYDDEFDVLDLYDEFQDIEATNPSRADQIVAELNNKPLYIGFTGSLAASWSATSHGGAVVLNAYGFAVLETSGTNSADAITNVTGLTMQEIGLSLGMPYKDFRFGITPKLQSVMTYDYSEPLSTVDTGGDFDTQSEKDNGNNFNLDAGVVYKLSESTQLGLVGRNLLAQDYQTILGTTIKFEPQFRAGIAYTGSWFAAAFDMDVTSNERIAFGEKTRTAGIGAEADAWILKLRAGYITDIENSRNNTATFGLSLFGINLAAQKNNTSLSGYIGGTITF